MLQSRCGRFADRRRHTSCLPEVESRFLGRKANGLVSVGWTKQGLRNDATGLPGPSVRRQRLERKRACLIEGNNPESGGRG